MRELIATVLHSVSRFLCISSVCLPFDFLVLTIEFFSLSSIPACWRVSDINWHFPVYILLPSLSFFPSHKPSIVPSFEQAFVELLMERFRALPRSGASSLSFIFSRLLATPIATFWSQFLTIERFPRTTQQISRKKISRNDFDNSGKVKIYEDDLRILSAFPRFPLSHSTTFHFPLYRYTYQLGRFESRLSIIHFRYLSKARFMTIMKHKYISNW